MATSSSTSSTSSTSSSASSSASSSSVTKRTCPLCTQPGLKVCAGCSKIGYCSKEHQREHWKEHKLVCEQKHKQAGASAAASTTSKPKAEDVQVTRDDQNRINAFSRLNTQLQNLQDELRTLKTDLANLNDAESDVSMLLDDNSCEVKVGEVFFATSNEEAEEYVTKKKEQVKRETEEKEQLVASIEKEMQQLRTVLYGKFGKAINLESAEQTVNDE